MDLIYPSFHPALVKFSGKFYDAHIHNEMRRALWSAGIQGDYDTIIAGFANVGAEVSRIVAARALLDRSSDPLSI
jgi:hypothetical protein